MRKTIILSIFIALTLLASCGSSSTIDTGNTSKVQALPDSSTTVETTGELPSGGIESGGTDVTELESIVY